MEPLPPPDRAVRIADLILDHDLAQVFSWNTTETLLAIARQDPGVDPDAASQLLHVVLGAIITSEILAGREASR